MGLSDWMSAVGDVLRESSGLLLLVALAGAWALWGGKLTDWMRNRRVRKQMERARLAKYQRLFDERIAAEERAKRLLEYRRRMERMEWEDHRCERKWMDEYRTRGEEMMRQHGINLGETDEKELSAEIAPSVWDPEGGVEWQRKREFLGEWIDDDG